MAKTVMVYEDPITQQKPEGLVELERKIWDGAPGELEYWRVRFLDGGEVTLRFIKAESERVRR